MPPPIGSLDPRRGAADICPSRLHGMSTAFEVRALTSTVRIELGDSLSRRPGVDPRALGRPRPRRARRTRPGDPRRHARRTPIGTASPFVIRADSPRSSPHGSRRRSPSGAISGLRGEALMLHASAVALDDGRVIGFVGPSGRGKTTASQALGRTYGYVTDETLAIRADGSVVAYPKPLSIGTRPDVKRHRAGLGTRASLGAGRGAAARGDRAARPAARRRTAVRRVGADHRGAARARPPDEPPAGARAARSAPSSRRCTRPVECAGSSTPRRSRCQPSSRLLHEFSDDGARAHRCRQAVLARLRLLRRPPPERRRSGDVHGPIRPGRTGGRITPTR